MNHYKNLRSADGLIATTALILLVTGTLAFVVATTSSVVSYADSVSSREYRIQKSFNQRACDDTLAIMLAKDYFFEGEVRLSDFDCTVRR